MANRKMKGKSKQAQSRQASNGRTGQQMSERQLERNIVQKSQQGRSGPG